MFRVRNNRLYSVFGVLKIRHLPGAACKCRGVKVYGSVLADRERSKSMAGLLLCGFETLWQGSGSLGKSFEA